MTASPVLARSASQLASAIRNGELTSEALVDLSLARIEEGNDRLRALVTLDEAGARAAAREIDAAVRSQRPVGPLAGIPLTIKDAIAVSGLRSTAGAWELAEHVPDYDAIAVRRLRAAGAVIIGKSNCARWSADVQTSNDLFGTTTNPHDPSRTAGGSSGGSAVAVASGFSALELGSDVGGSIRIPAHCCGVFGLKPTFGVIPQAGYLGHAASRGSDMDMNVIGPLARSADDLDLALTALLTPAGGLDQGWAPPLPAPRHRTPSVVRVGVWAGPDGFTDRATRHVVADAADAAGRAGCDVVESHPRIDLEEQNQLFLRLLQAALSQSESASARSITHRRWLEYGEHRAGLRAEWVRWFMDVDALICPVMPVAAFPHDLGSPMSARRVALDDTEIPYGRLVAWTGLVGMVGLPAVSMPVGRTGQGLPLGVQVVTPWHRDREAIQLAKWLTLHLGSPDQPSGVSSLIAGTSPQPLTEDSDE